MAEMRSCLYILVMIVVLFGGCGRTLESPTTTSTALGATSTSTTTPTTVTTIIQQDVESILIMASTTSVTVEGMIEFKGYFVYADSSTFDATSEFNWHSSNTSVASVDVYGTFRAASAGTTTISATYESLTSNSIEVTVTPAPGDILEAVKNSMVFTSLEVFPVDLTELFSLEAGTIDSIQTTIRNGGPLAAQSSLLISPFMQHFGTAHSEGTGKWYIWAQSVMEVRAPGAIYIDAQNPSANYWEDRSTTTVNGETVYSNCRLDFWLDSEKSIRFDHMDFLASHVEALLASAEGFLIIPAGERIGYTRGGQGLDFYMSDSNIDNGISEGLEESSGMNYRVCPLSYYTAQMQASIEGYYNDVIYSAMQAGGKWPESAIDGPVNINITGEVWGTWYYKSGTIEGVDLERVTWFHFDKAILTFLAQSRTNSETFFMEIDPDTNTSIEAVCPNWAGLYTQYVTANDQAYLVLEDGNNVSGIFSRRAFETGDILNYIRFEVDLKTGNLFNDELNVKYFDTLAEAQADAMASGYVTYVKDDERANSQ